MSSIVAIVSIDRQPDPFNNNQVRNRLSLSRKVDFGSEPKLAKAINDARQEIAGEEELAKAQLLPLQKMDGTQAFLVSFEGDEENGYEYKNHGIRTVDSSRSPWTWKSPRRKKSSGFQFPKQELAKVENG